MKTTKKADPRISELQEKIGKFFPSHEEKLNVMSTLLGMGWNLAEWASKQDILEPPEKCKYSILNIARFCQIYHDIIHGNIEPDAGLDLRHMPTDDTSWQSKEDFEKRFIFVVKKYYEELKKEGKI